MKLLALKFRKLLDDNKSDIFSLYSNIFFFLSDEELNSMLNFWMKEYFEDKEDWFTAFHESINQIAHFDIEAYRIVDYLTEEKNIRRNNILAKRRKEVKEHCPNNTILERSVLDSMPERLEETMELINLNNIMTTKEPIAHVSQKLDSMLYHLIHMDKKGELATVMSTFFEKNA